MEQQRLRQRQSRRRFALVAAIQSAGKAPRAVVAAACGARSCRDSLAEHMVLVCQNSSSSWPCQPTHRMLPMRLSHWGRLTVGEQGGFLDGRCWFSACGDERGSVYLARQVDRTHVQVPNVLQYSSTGFAWIGDTTFRTLAWIEDTE